MILAIPVNTAVLPTRLTIVRGFFIVASPLIEAGARNHLLKGIKEEFMKVWKGLLIVGLALVLVGSFACNKGGKYGDAKALLAKMLDGMDNFAASMEKVTDAKGAASVINKFKDLMAGLKPKMKALDEKYPELKDQANPPEELKAEMKRMEEIGGKMMNAMMKAAQFSSDPEVQKAQEALNKVMQD